MNSLKQLGMRGALVCALLGPGASSAQAQAPAAMDAPASSRATPGVAPKIDSSAAPPAVKAAARVTAAQRDRVLLLLSGYEYFPSRAELDAVAAEEAVSALLLELLADTAQPPSMRSRAVDALGYYRRDEVVAALRVVALTDTDTIADGARLRAARSLRYHAITSYARAGGEATLGDLRQLMQHDDLQIQLSAISAVGKHLEEAGHVVLRERMAVERDAVVRRELLKHLPAADRRAAP